MTKSALFIEREKYKLYIVVNTMQKLILLNTCCEYNTNWEWKWHIKKIGEDKRQFKKNWKKK